MPVIVETITTTNDAGTLKYYLGGSTLGFYSADVRMGVGSYAYSPRFRFQTIPIAKNETINSAVFDFGTPVSGGNPGPPAANNGRMYGLAADDPAAAPTSGQAAALAKTTAYSVVPPSVTTVTVTAIIQEIVNRAGWASGNDLVLLGLVGLGDYTMSANGYGYTDNTQTLTINYGPLSNKGLYVGVDAAYKTVDTIHVGVGGAWKAIDEAWIGVDGAWKQFFKS